MEKYAILKLMDFLPLIWVYSNKENKDYPPLEDVSLYNKLHSSMFFLVNVDVYVNALFVLHQMGCSGSSHNSMSTLFLTTPEGCLKALLHDPIGRWSRGQHCIVFFLKLRL